MVQGHRWQLSGMIDRRGGRSCLRNTTVSNSTPHSPTPSAPRTTRYTRRHRLRYLTQDGLQNGSHDSMNPAIPSRPLTEAPHLTNSDAPNSNTSSASEISTAGGRHQNPRLSLEPGAANSRHPHHRGHSATIPTHRSSETDGRGTGPATLPERDQPNELWQLRLQGRDRDRIVRVSPLTILDDDLPIPPEALRPCTDLTMNTAWNVLWDTLGEYSLQAGPL